MHLHAALAAGGADKIRLVGPVVGGDLDVVAATMIAAIDQHLADAGCAHFKGDLLRVGCHGLEFIR